MSNVATQTVRVDGLRELGEAMRGLSAKVAKRIAGQATAAAAKLVKTTAQSNIRQSPAIDTGSLLGAIIVKKLPKGKLAGLTVAHIVTVRGRGKPANKKGQKIDRAPHAHLVEFGTVNMPAEPFLRPAYESEKRKAVDVIAERLRRGIAKAKR